VRPLALVVALSALVLAACGGGRDEAAPVTQPEETQPAVMPGPADGPAIAGTGLDGETLSIAELRGRPVMVNVWSSW
jgi:hypothetical protein